MNTDHTQLLLTIASSILAQASKLEEVSTYTYFILNPETNRVKIGKSARPKERMANLETGAGSKLQLLAVLPVDIEAQLHQYFHEERVFLEWFSYGTPIKTLLRALKNLPASVGDSCQSSPGREASSGLAQASKIERTSKNAKYAAKLEAELRAGDSLVTLGEIATHVLGVSDKDYTRGLAIDLGKALNALGFASKVTTRGGKNGRYYSVDTGGWMNFTE